MSEEQIIEGCLRKQQAAYNLLYKKYRGYIRSVAHSHCSVSYLVDDIVQDTFIKVFLKISQYNKTGPFKAWLYRICTTTAYNHLADEKRRHQVPIENCSHVVKDGYFSVLLTAEELQKAIDTLPSKQRKVFCLYTEGYLHNEIATMLGVQESTSKSQFKRAKDKLNLLITEWNRA